MNNNLTQLSTKLLIGLTLFLPLKADLVYLKSKRKIEGIIIEKDSLSIKMDLAIGQMSFLHTNIDSINQNSEAANLKLREKWAATEQQRSQQSQLDAVEHILRQLKDLRGKAEDAKLSTFYRDKKRTEQDKELYELNQLYLKYNKQLKEMKYWDNPKLYSELFDKRSQTHAKIEELKNESNETPVADKNENNETPEELMNRFTLEFNKIPLNSLNKQEKERMNSILSEYKNLAFMHEDNAVPFLFANNNSIVVRVRINNRIYGQFILDTGASTVVFCENFAKKLNLDLTGIQPIQSTVADGRTVDGFPVLLESVAVGKFKSKQINATVLKTPPSENIDGLLGMSYLKNYIINFDAQAKKLYFKNK